ncbi:MAG TPA: hypothetical protein VGE52_04255 [Pirellulales bacterium]
MGGYASGGGGLSAGADPALLGDGSVDATEFGRLDGASGNIQTQLDAKASTAALTAGLAGKAPTSHVHSGADITSGTVPVAAMPTGIPAASIGPGTVDNTEFGYLNGVTAGIQTQLDLKTNITSLGLTAPCRLVLSGGSLTLALVDGRRMQNPLNQEVCDLSGVTPLAATGTVAGTLYFIFLDTGTGALSRSTTSPSTTSGIQHASGDVGQVLVGAAVPVSGPAWAFSGANLLVCSLFNPETFDAIADGADQINIAADNTWRSLATDPLLSLIRHPRHDLEFHGRIHLQHASATTPTRAGIDVGLSGTPAKYSTGRRASGSSSYYDVHAPHAKSVHDGTFAYVQARMRVYGDNSGSTDTFDVIDGASCNYLRATMRG